MKIITDFDSTHGLDPKKVGSALSEYGFVKIVGLDLGLSESINMGFGQYLSRPDKNENTQGHNRKVFSNINLVLMALKAVGAGKEETKALSSLVKLMSSETLKSIRCAIELYLGRRPLVSDYLYQISPPRKDQARILGWHADIGQTNISSRMRRVKGFIYLNDIDEKNGAFSYVPRSHIFSLQLRELAIESGANSLNTIEDFFKFCETIKDEDSQGPVKFFRDLQNNIKENQDKTNKFMICGKAGTIVLFDELGIHAGGIVTEGLRQVFRIGYRSEDMYWKNVGCKSALPRSFAARLPFTKLRHIF